MSNNILKPGEFECSRCGLPSPIPELHQLGDRNLCRSCARTLLAASLYSDLSVREEAVNA